MIEEGTVSDVDDRTAQLLLESRVAEHAKILQIEQAGRLIIRIAGQHAAQCFQRIAVELFRMGEIGLQVYHEQFRHYVTSWPLWH